jgi:hypothetical protein
LNRDTPSSTEDTAVVPRTARPGEWIAHKRALRVADTVANVDLPTAVPISEE